MGLSAKAVEDYLDRFIYRLGQSEEEGLSKFRELLHVHHLF